MKHIVTLLTTSDLEGLQRLVYIVQNEIIPSEDICTEFVIVVNTLDDEYYERVLAQNFPLKVVRTESNGTAARGKNTCQQLMLDEGFDYLTQFDADDILYPTFLLSLAEHIKRMPCIDVLGIIPCDTLTDWHQTQGHAFRASDKLYGSVWGISITHLADDIRGVRKHPYLWESEGTCPSQDYLILQSRKACQIMMDETMIQAEDHLHSFKYLGQHQKGELFYAQTMSSDMYLIDRSFPGSVQKTTEFDYVSRLKEEVPRYVPVWRSSFGELPCNYIDLKMSHHEKEDWVIKVLKDFERYKNSS
jgi:hypothetical protein